MKPSAPRNISFQGSKPRWRGGCSKAIYFAPIPPVHGPAADPEADIGVSKHFRVAASHRLTHRDKRKEIAGMNRSTDLNNWPDHLRRVFASIGAAMNGKRLHPQTLDRVDGTGIVSDHEVSIRHISGAAAGPAGNHYLIEITGPRIVGRWPFRSGELETLSRSATIHLP